MNKFDKIYKNLTNNRLYKLLEFEDLGDTECRKVFAVIEDLQTKEQVIVKDEVLVELECPAVKALYDKTNK